MLMTRFMSSINSVAINMLIASRARVSKGLRGLINGHAKCRRSKIGYSTLISVTALKPPIRP
jgi:hypothetical protein